MLEVVTPATHYRLTTVAALKTLLGISGSDQDAALELLLDRTSAAISTWCGRVFARETVKETHRITRRFSQLVLARTPVVSMNSLTVYGDECPSPSLEVDNQAGIVREGLPLGLLALTYTAGYILPGEEGANLPPDLEQAALNAAQFLSVEATRNPGLKAEEVDGLGRREYFVPNGRETTFLANVIPLIAPYRTPGLA